MKKYIQNNMLTNRVLLSQKVLQGREEYEDWLEVQQRLKHPVIRNFEFVKVLE